MQEPALLAAFDGVIPFEVVSLTQMQLVGMNNMLANLRKQARQARNVRVSFIRRLPRVA